MLDAWVAGSHVSTSHGRSQYYAQYGGSEAQYPGDQGIVKLYEIVCTESDPSLQSCPSSLLFVPALVIAEGTSSARTRSFRGMVNIQQFAKVV